MRTYDKFNFGMLAMCVCVCVCPQVYGHARIPVHVACMQFSVCVQVGGGCNAIYTIKSTILAVGSNKVTIFHLKTSKLN